MTIFFDLDGTIINSKIRLYTLFDDLITKNHLTYDDYWTLKRKKLSHKFLIQSYFSHINYASFEKEWLDKIETDEYLKLDKPYAGVTTLLDKLYKKNITMNIVTARQKPNKVTNQLSKFGWSKFFENVLVTEQKYEKKDLIKPLLNNDNETYLIGDTGLDIICGKKLNLITIAVTNGFLNKDSLLEYKPDYMIDDVVDFLNINND